MSDTPSPRDVDALIADFERSDLRELHVRTDGFELHLSRDRDAVVSDVSAAPVAGPPPPPAPVAAPIAAPPPSDIPPGATVIAAPYLGTFYLAPKPGAAPFVSIGDRVTPDTELCLVEVMKLFTSVRAGIDGVVHAILATDGALVQADQPLIILSAG